jgi:hypothetical protein
MAALPLLNGDRRQAATISLYSRFSCFAEKDSALPMTSFHPIKIRFSDGRIMLVCSISDVAKALGGA